MGIEARLQEDEVQITVWDTGIGIAPADLERIFEEFQQAGGPSTQKREGTGLGLSLARKFVELHGGRIWVESLVDQGSRFTFTLPVHRALQPVVTPGEESPTIPEREAPVILVVEDDPQAAELLRLYLEGAGYHIEIAWDGEEGFRKACTLKPDLLTLDLFLPKIDGWDLLARLKGEPTTREIPVVIVSIVEERGKGFALGAADYLVKPVRREELIHALQRFNLTKKRQQREDLPILVIDDDPMAVELVEAILRGERFQVRKAYSGAEGITVARQEKPALIVLDLLMPEVDGFTVVEQLRADPVTASIPIVILTSKNLTPEEKKRLNGKISSLARKGEFSRATFVELVRGCLPGGSSDPFSPGGSRLG